MDTEGLARLANRRTLSRILHYTLCGLILLIPIALKLWVVQIVTIGGEGCQPDICAGDRIAVMRRAYSDSKPKQGDWVTFTDPRDNSGLCVGRIYACPGDTLWIDQHGQVTDSPEDACDLVQVPRTGLRVLIDQQNIRLYDRAITHYEPVKSAIVDDNLYISGEAVNDYSFTRDYYWVSSVDSGSDSNLLGVIPASLITGRVACVLYSYNDTTGWSGYRTIE